MPRGVRRRAWLLATAAVLALAPLAAPPRDASAQAAGKPFDLDALMALLARRQSGEARFTEERFVTGFDGPLRASGTLAFTAPDRFVRQTLEPRRERMEVAGNQVRLERGGRVRQLSLDAVPELAALIEGLRGTLTGNAALLRRHFDLSLTGAARLWTLTLVPRDAALAQQVRQLQIVGTGGELRTVELSLAGSDRSMMTIEPLAAAR
ncbi:MAG: outer membrane lipoprotein carrier protein LolA [Rubrivivax sp.]|nr:outer membrane lipoprotein carrier protein LolA [Rubrivivax sp.]